MKNLLIVTLVLSLFSFYSLPIKAERGSGREPVQEHKK